MVPAWLALMLAAGTVQAGALWWDGGTTDIGGNGDGLSAGGGGTWNTMIMNWDQGAELPYVAWNNANNDTAVFGGSGGTVTQGTDITLGGLEFATGSTASTTVAGSTLNFGAGGAINNLNSTAEVSQIITSAITGSPSVGVAASLSGGDVTGGLRFAPASGTVTLGTITLALNANTGGLSDKTVVWLSGSTTGNTVGGIQQVTDYSTLRCDSGEWTVTGTAQVGRVWLEGSGVLKLTGTLDLTAYTGITIFSGGTLHYNSPGAVNSNYLPNSQAIILNGGNLDQTSGLPITTSTHNPYMRWDADFTFLGSNGANSALNLGTGLVLLTGTRMVTINNDATLTVGGAISDNSNGYGLTKAGTGTLVLAGTNTYGGGTTIVAGTLQADNPDALGTGALSISNPGKANLNYSGDHVVSALVIEGTAKPPGTYGSSSSPATAPDDDHFTGTGTVTVMASVNTTFRWDGGTTDIVGNGDGLSAGGDGTWNTTILNWDQGAGLPHVAWNSATNNDTAVFGGSGGTVTLGTDITLGGLEFAAGSTASHTVAGGTLNFEAGGAITNLNSTPGVSQIITTAITGSPSVSVAASLDGGDVTGGLRFAPASGTVTLGTITLALNANNGVLSDKTVVWLSGSTTGNTVGGIQQITSYSALRCDSGEWTVTGTAQAGRIRLEGTGVLKVTGTLDATSYDAVRIYGGTLHYNSPGAVHVLNTWENNNVFDMSGGNLDQTSGAPITTSTYNPYMQWSADFTFLGSNGANSDLNLGTGPVLLTGTRTVTIHNDATLTVGGVISSGANGYGLTKDGTGTLVLAGANTYGGDTTVLAGTLAVNGNSIADTNKLVIDGGKVDVAAAAEENVSTLYFGTNKQPDGTYGSTSSSATYQDDTRFSGTGIVIVSLQTTGILLTTANSGSGTLTFDTAPLAGQWSTFDITTGDSSTLSNATTMDAAAQALSASNIATALVAGTDTTNRLAQYYNQALYTRPTGVPAVVLMATLRNMTGSAINGLTIAYDYGMSAGGGEQVPGHRVYYSMTGLVNTWTVVPALCSATPGTLTTNVDLSGTPLVADAVMYVLWLDDNATSTEEINTIDNVSFTINTQGGYASWAHDYAGDGAPNEDYNNDGVANGVAFFMGMNGLATNPGVVAGKITWPYANEVASYEVQVSDNLSDWAPAAAEDIATTLPPGGQVIYTLPTGAAKKFCRLMVVP